MRYGAQVIDCMLFTGGIRTGAKADDGEHGAAVRVAHAFEAKRPQQCRVRSILPGSPVADVHHDNG
jgi:hypothetical protein